MILQKFRSKLNKKLFKLKIRNKTLSTFAHSNLLLKHHYDNIMEMPKVYKVMVSSQVPYEFVSEMALALEMLCGQAPFHIQKSAGNSRSAFDHASSKARTSQIVRCCLRKKLMHNWLVKMITVLGFYEYTTTIQLNTIQLRIKPNLLRLFPEIQHLIELFFHIQAVDIFIFTSSKSVLETRLFWSALLQREI